MKKYAKLPMDLADASLEVLADHLGPGRANVARMPRSEIGEAVPDCTSFHRGYSSL